MFSLADVGIILALVGSVVGVVIYYESRHQALAMRIYRLEMFLKYRSGMKVGHDYNGNESTE